MIARIFGFLWFLVTAFTATAFRGIRYGSGSFVFLSFLVAVFFVVGLVLTLLGIDLEAANQWIERQTWWLEIVGIVIFKLILAGILAICALVVASPIIDRRTPTKQRKGADKADDNRPGGCMIAGALLIGYFCVVGIFFS